MSEIPSRALKETLRDQLAPSSASGCIEADMLAAWSDGTLSKRERAIVESHAAGCGRCQALLAVMAKTAAPQPARKWWQASTVRWLAPIGAVSVLAIAVWMHTPAPRLTAPTPVADLELRAGAPSAGAVEAPRADTAPPAAKENSSLDRRTTSKPAGLLAAEDRERNTPDKKTADSPVPTSAPTISAADAAPISAQAAAAQAPAAVQTPPQPQAASAPPPSAEAKSNAFRARSGALAETVTILPQRSALDASVPRDIPSPDQNVRWRIVTGNRVQRSTDAGVTWQTQSTGTIQPLMAGAAPSSTLCWLVGRAGTVLVSSDGQTWLRVAFPEAVDLTAITATDASTATVTTADGRTFRTSDGGKTWQALQNR